MGFSLVFAGGEGVVWNRPKEEFPYVDGFVPVVLSWFVSPIAAGLVACIIFLLVRTLVLRRINSTKIAIWVSAWLGRLAGSGIVRLAAL
jgi:sodium-dependent phosphate transporter